MYIKREDAIKAIVEYFSDSDDSHWNAIATYIINGVPSAEEHGEWIRKTKQCQGYLYTCSECGQVIYSETDYDLKEFHAYCGRCGARMKGADDEL